MSRVVFVNQKITKTKLKDLKLTGTNILSNKFHELVNNFENNNDK